MPELLDDVIERLTDPGAVGPGRLTANQAAALRAAYLGLLLPDAESPAQDVADLSLEPWLAASALILRGMIPHILASHPLTPGRASREVQVLVTCLFGRAIAAVATHQSGALAEHAADLRREGDIANLRNLAASMRDLNA